MHGPHIEQQFKHFEFENEQLRRKMATRRLFDEQHQERPRHSLMDIFGRFFPRPDQRVPAHRSIVTPS